MKTIYLFIAIFIISFYLMNTYYEQRDQVNTIELRALNSSYNTLKETHYELQDNYVELRVQKGNKKLNQLLNLMYDIHNRYNYTEDFRCLNFSRIMKEEAEGLGFKNTIVYGQMKDTDNYTSHTWNRFVLDIDSTFNTWDIDRDVFDYHGEWIERD